MAFAKKTWQDGPTGGTPIDAAALNDLENRIAGVDTSVAAETTARSAADTTLQTAVDAKLDASEKGQPDGVAELDATGKVPAAQLPETVESGSVPDPSAQPDGKWLVTSGGALIYTDAPAGGSGQWRDVEEDLPLGATYTFDCANAPFVRLFATLGADCDITLSNVLAGSEIKLLLTQDATGGWNPSVTLAGVTEAVPGIDTAPGAVNKVVIDTGDATDGYVSVPGVGGSGGSVTDPSVVLADAAHPDGASDDTAYLQGLVNQAVAAGKTLRIPPSTNPWRIAELTLPSGARVDATGATFMLPSSTPKRFLINTAQTLAMPGSVRDTNIEWVGGTFDRGTIGRDGTDTPDSRGVSLYPKGFNGMNVMLAFVDGFKLAGLKLIQSGVTDAGLYGIHIYACTKGTVTNFEHSVPNNVPNTDSVHLYGGCRDIVVDGVRGQSGDDMVALLPRDRTGYLEFPGAIGGDIENVTVRNVFASGGSNGVRITGGNTDDGATVWTSRNIRVEQVDGQFGVNGPNPSAVWIGGLSSYVGLNRGQVEGVTCENVRQRLASRRAVVLGDSGHVSNVTLRNCKNSDSTTAIAISGLTIPSATLTVEDTEFESTLTTGTYFAIDTGATGSLHALRLKNVRLKAATTGTATVGLVKQGAVGYALFAEACAFIGKTIGLGQLANTARLFIRGLYFEDALATGWFTVNNAAAAVEIRDFAGWSGGPNDFVKTAGAVTCFEPRFPCDVSKLALTANQTAYNTNAALACGVGPVVCDGTHWKHLYTGATTA